MPRKQRYRPQDFRSQFCPVLSERPEEPAPLLAIFAQRGLGCAQVAFQNYRRAIIQRMR